MMPISQTPSAPTIDCAILTRDRSRRDVARAGADGGEKERIDRVPGQMRGVSGLSVRPLVGESLPVRDALRRARDTRARRASAACPTQ